jgi:hypothetical protein
MITKAFTKGDAVSEAVYSDCERYRYLLSRVWAQGPKALFVMLNPSTATEEQNDPTVERCERRARALGFGAFRVTNIFAYRATDPRVMRAADDPVGPGNDAAILQSVPWADAVVCAWGNHGLHLDRGQAVEAMLRASGARLSHLGLTGQGQPRHPLYVVSGQHPEDWR